MREVVGPHEVVRTTTGYAPDGVVESGVDLVVEVFAGECFDGQAFALGTIAFEVAC